MKHQTITPSKISSKLDKYEHYFGLPESKRKKLINHAEQDKKASQSVQQLPLEIFF